MVPSIQSTSPSLFNAEPYNPDRIVAFMGQFFSSVSRFSQTPELLLSQIRDADHDIREVASLLDLLVARQAQAGSSVTPELIKAAIKDGTSLVSLFASDPENLGIDLEQANKLVHGMMAAGVAIDAKLFYPVVVISSDQNNKQEERLVWMTESERLSLDAYPVTEEKAYAPHMARSKSEGGQVTHYVFLDEQSNLRISSDALDSVISRVNELLSQKRNTINAGRLRLSTELESIGLLLDGLRDVINSSLKNNFMAMNSRWKKVAEDAEDERIRSIWFARLRSDLEHLSKEDNFHATASGEK